MGVATALTLCCLQQPASAQLAVSASADASAGIDDICVQVDVTGLVTQSVGHCEPTQIPTREFSHHLNIVDVLWVDVLVRT